MHGTLSFFINVSQIPMPTVWDSNVDRHKQFIESYDKHYPHLNSIATEDKWIEEEGGKGKFEVALTDMSVGFDVNEDGDLILELIDADKRNIGPLMTENCCLAIRGKIWIPAVPGVSQIPGTYLDPNAESNPTRGILDWDKEKEMWCLDRIWATDSDTLCVLIQLIRSGALRPAVSFAGVRTEG